MAAPFIVRRKLIGLNRAAEMGWRSEILRGSQETEEQ